MKDLKHEPCSEFGACPECGKCDCYMNVNRNHWLVCHEHKYKWCAGLDLFGTWRDENDDTWDANAEHLAGYATVIPRYFMTAFEELRQVQMRGAA